MAVVPIGFFDEYNTQKQATMIDLITCCCSSAFQL